MEFSIWKNIFVVLFMTSVFAGGVSFITQHSKNYFVGQTAAIVVAETTPGPLSGPIGTLSVPPPPQKLANPPEIIKSVYVTGYSAGNQKYLDYLSNLFKTTQINAVVIDIKDYSGKVSYNSGAILDINGLVEFLHSQNIYVIGRIVVFEDPAYAKARPELAIFDKLKSAESPEPSRRVLWGDNNGLSWMDPASKDVWDYNISLAKDALDSHGFDEINFDYVRFPSDGNMENLGYPVYDGKIPKEEIIKEFFQYARQQLAGATISADLFGQTTVNKDDMGIGQILEDALENFDYVCPMVYPSHYATGFIGYANPAQYPYEVIKYSMSSAEARENILLNQNGEAAKLRPWIQDFNMGADYTVDMVKEEIKATQDAMGADFTGFMMWNPSNIYTADAVLK